MRVIFRAWGQPSDADPIGARWQERPDAVPVDVWAERRADGVIVIGTHEQHGAVEGSDPGQWRQVSGHTVPQVAAVMSRLRALAQDSDPVVRAIAGAVVATITNNGRRASVQSLLTAAENSLAIGERRGLAVLALGLLLSDVVEA